MTELEETFEYDYAHYIGGIIYVPLSLLDPHPDNPRRDLGDLTELTASIAENGVYQNLTVVPVRNEDGEETGRFRIVIGHRRAAAAKLAGDDTVPCIIAKHMAAREEIETMLIENMQRSDLNVYEQAESFQMMLDLGGVGVEGIAKRTGFSETTVRKRLKMAELDKDKLRQVATDENRQLTLGDFDRLAQIEDIKERNKVLEKIGTRDFNQAVASALTEQKEKHNLPLIKAWLKEVGAKKLANKDTRGDKYESYDGRYSINVSKWGEDGNKSPKVGKIPIFYVLESWGGLRLYKKREKPPKEKKSAAQLEKERSVREAWKRVKELDAMFYGLRRAYIEQLSVTKTNRPLILAGALVASLLEVICYNSPNREALEKLVCGGGVTWANKDKKLWEGYRELDGQKLPAVVYELFGDSEKVNFTQRSLTSNYPRWERTVKIDMLYGWLNTLGYEPSTEEQAWMDGSHEAYHVGEEAQDGQAEADEDED